jgi:hypothetical protein
MLLNKKETLRIEMRSTSEVIEENGTASAINNPIHRNILK